MYFIWHILDDQEPKWTHLDWRKMKVMDIKCESKNFRSNSTYFTFNQLEPFIKIVNKNKCIRDVVSFWAKFQKNCHLDSLWTAATKMSIHLYFVFRSATITYKEQQQCACILWKAKTKSEKYMDINFFPLHISLIAFSHFMLFCLVLNLFFTLQGKNPTSGKSIQAFHILSLHFVLVRCLYTFSDKITPYLSVYFKPAILQVAYHYFTQNFLIFKI